MLKLRVREVAESKDINQAQLAWLSHTGVKTIALYWHKKNYQVDLWVLDRIAKALGVPAGSLLIEVPDADEKGQE